MIVSAIISQTPTVKITNVVIHTFVDPEQEGVESEEKEEVSSMKCGDIGNATYYHWASFSNSNYIFHPKLWIFHIDIL